MDKLTSESPLPSLKNLFGWNIQSKADAAEEFEESTAVSEHPEQNRPPLTLRSRLPDLVGKHMQNKILVGETQDHGLAILVVHSFAQSPQLEQVRKTVGERYPGRTIEVHPVTPLELVTYAKGESEAGADTRTQASSYEMALEEIVLFAVTHRAADISLDIDHTASMSQIGFKIDGRQLRPPEWRMETKRLTEIVNIAWQGVAGGAHSSFDRDVESQGIYTLPVGKRAFKLRFQSIITDVGPSIVLRLLEQGVVKSLENYGYLPTHLAILKQHKAAGNGLVCISGKVGSGKTTLVTAAIDTLPRHFKVFMLEDPVEILLEDVQQITVSRPVDGSGDELYTRKLMALKRVAPDAVSLGEVRDPLNARAITDIGGMGTLGFFTLHASCALQAPQKLWSESIGVPRDFLASPGMLRLLVHQALVPRLCSCAKDVTSLIEDGGVDSAGDFKDGGYWFRYIQQLEAAFDIKVKGMKVRNPEGCDHCRKPHFPDLNGYAGRQPIVEMIEPNKHHALLHHIAQGDTLGMYDYFNTLPRKAIDDPDMHNKTIVECGLYLALQGLLDPRDIEQATESFESLIQQPRYRRPEA